MPTSFDLLTRMAQDRLVIAQKLDGTYDTARSKRINIWNAILEAEISTGTTFMLSMPDASPYISINMTREIFRIPRSGRGGDDFLAYLNRRYGLNESEPITRYVLGEFRNYAIKHGSHVELRRFSMFKAQTVYLSGYNGMMWRVDGQEIMPLQNGDDDVFFVDDDGGKHVDPEVGEHGLLFNRLIDEISFAESGMGGITAEQMRRTYAIWIFALAFPDLLPTKPLLILEGMPGSGKCLGLGTPVLYFDGTVKPVEDICVGDLLMGPDSRPRRVLSLSRGHDQMFRIIPVKGQPWTCNSSHILTLVSSHSKTGELIDIPVQDYLNKTARFRLDRKQFTVGVDFPEHSSTPPIDPYFLGVWYGDGTKDLKSVTISKPDPEIRQAVMNIAVAWNLKVREFTNTSGCPGFAITSGEAHGKRNRNPLLDALRHVVGLGEIFPTRYLTGSRKERAEFLAGLLDTDGYYDKGCYEIIQKRKGFADGICFLAQSLGLRACLTSKYIKGYDLPYWRVSISGEMSFLPLRIERKKPKQRRQIKDVTRTAITVEPIGMGEYAGFTLDGDGRFLLGDFTVTHNSSAVQLLQIALMGETKPIILSRNKEDDFGVILLRSPICVFDNLDAYVEWVPDAICAYTTAGKWTRRKLFTDAEEITLKPHAFIAVASKNPASFRREDVADRCLILRLERRTQFLSFQGLEADVRWLRPQIFGEYLHYINLIVAEIRAGGLGEVIGESHRMADYAAFGRVVAKILGWENGAVDDLLEALRGEQAAFISEEDPLSELLDKWLSLRTKNGPSNIGRHIDLFTLHKELESISQINGITYYKSARTLAQKLRSPHIERDFIVLMTAPDGHKSYQIWRKSDARLSSVPMSVEE